MNRVIKADTLRTRAQQYDQELRDKLEMILTFYCIKKNITYKQGLNEVAAPFVFFLKTNNTSLSTVYNYFQIFMDRFIPTLYNDSEFHSLQCYFNLFQLLIKYHDAELFKHLQDNFTTPELYATSWFLTLFSNKMSLELIYYFWEIYIVENDSHFIFFISLAVLLFNKESLLKCDPAMLPQKLTQLSVDTIDDVKAIYTFALQLKSNTPISFGLKIHSMQLMNKQKCCSNPELFFNEMKEYSHQIEKVIALPIHPLEILKQIHPEYFYCQNIYCVTNDKLYQGLKYLQSSDNNHQSNSNPFAYFPLTEQMKTSQYQKECDYCKSEIDNKNEIKGFLKDNIVLNELLKIQIDHYKMKKQNQSKNIKYMILDIRRNRNKVNTGRILCQSINGISDDNYEQNQIIAQQLCESYQNKKNQIHFLLLTNDLYSVQIKNDDSDDNHNNNQGDDQQDLNNDLNSDESQIDQQIARLFLETFAENSFPYVGIIEGGFKQIHNLMKIQQLEIIDHNQKLCHFCNKTQPQKKIQKSKSKNIFERIVEVFAFNDDEEDQQAKEAKENQLKLQKQQQQQQQLQQQKQYVRQNYQSSNQPQNSSYQSNNNNNGFSIDCRQTSTTPIRNSQNSTTNVPQRNIVIGHFIDNNNNNNNNNNSSNQSENIINRQETQSNCVENENEESQRHIQHSTFQVKHSTPHKSTSTFHTRDSSVLSQQNQQQISPRPFQSHKQSSSNQLIKNNNSILLQQNQKIDPKTNELQTNQISKNTINIHQQDNQQLTFNTVFNQKQTSYPNNDSVTQRNSSCNNSLSQNNNNNNNINGINRGSVVSQGNGQYNQQNISEQEKERTNNNNINQFSTYQIKEKNNLSGINITDRRDTSIKGNRNSQIPSNKPSLSPHARQSSTSQISSNQNKQINLQSNSSIEKGIQSQRINHNSFHSFSSNSQQNVINSQKNKSNNVLVNLKEQFDLFQNQQSSNGNNKKIITNNNNSNVQTNIQNNNNQSKIGINLNSQNSGATVFSSSSSSTQPSSQQQQQQNKNATTPLKSHTSSNILANYGQTNTQFTSINSSKQINNNKMIPSQVINPMNDKLTQIQNASSPFNSNIINQINPININLNNNISNANNINNASNISSNAINNNASIMNTINLQKSQLTNECQNKTPSKNYDFSGYDVQTSQQGRGSVMSSLASTPQSRILLDAQINSQNHIQLKKGSNSICSVKQDSQGNDINSDYIVNTRDSRQLNSQSQLQQQQQQQQQQFKSNSYKSTSSNMRFVNQENNTTNNNNVSALLQQQLNIQQQQLQQQNIQQSQQLLQQQQNIQSTLGVRVSNKSFHGVGTSTQPFQSQSSMNGSFASSTNQFSNIAANLTSQQSSQNFQKFSVASVQSAVNASIQSAAANVASLQLQSQQQQHNSQQFFKPISNQSQSIINNSNISNINNNNNNMNGNTTINSNNSRVFSSNEFSAFASRPSMPMSSTNTPIKRNSQTNTSTSNILTNLSNLNNVSTNQRFMSTQQSHQVLQSQQQNHSQTTNSLFNNDIIGNQQQLLQQQQSYQSNLNIPIPNSELSLNQNISQINNYNNINNNNFSNVLQSNQNLINKIQDHFGMTDEMQQQQKNGSTQIKQQDNTQLIKTMKRYKKSGLFKSCIIPIEQHTQFFDLFERNKFSYYICDRLKENQNQDKNDDDDTQNNNNNNNKSAPKTSKSILIVSTEYVLTLKHYPQVEQRIQRIKEDQQKILKQLMEGKSISNKQEKSSFPSTFGQNLKIRSKENNIGQQNNPNINNNNNNQQLNCELKIKSFYLMKTLLKITSKKHDKQMHSFYFKLPQIFKLQQNLQFNQQQSNLLQSSSQEYLNLIQNFNFDSLYDLIVNRNQSKYTAHIADKSKTTEFVESKITVKIYGEENAADCIKMSQNFFQINKSNGISQII